MRRIVLPLIIICLIHTGLHSDTFILKDGKSIEGTILKDAGDSYEIETDKGARQTLKKADVEKIVPAVKELAAPLTDASFAFDKKRKVESVDVLASIDPKKDALTGTWKLVGKNLTASDGAHAKLQVTYVPPEEYDLELVLMRRDGSEDFFLGLVGGGRQFTFHLDAFGSAWSGPQQVDGKRAGAESEVGVPGRKVFTNGTARTAVFMIRKDGYCVRLDGKDFFVWKGDWSRMSLHPIFIVPNKNALFFGAFSSTWVISGIKVTTPKN